MGGGGSRRRWDDYDSGERWNDGGREKELYKLYRTALRVGLLALLFTYL